MNLLWVSPYNSRSAIARFSLFVTRELKDHGHKISIIRCEDGHVYASTRSLESNVIHWSEVRSSPSAFWNSFDAAIYNIGDHYPFHEGAVYLMRRFPGIVIVHDYYLLSLFSAWRAAENNGAWADAIVDDLYGAGSASRLSKSSSRRDVFEYTSKYFPMTEWIARQAHGAVAHSGFYADRLRASCIGPVLETSLAYDGFSNHDPPCWRTDDSPLNLLTFGRVNKNKQVGTVLRAIAASEGLRKRCRYEVVGLISEEDRINLLRQARELSFTGLKIFGEVSQSALEEHKKNAHIICNLRWPALEGASASAIEGMLSKRPLIVTNTGFYRDLPDDLVFKVDPYAMEKSLMSALERLAKDPAMGMRVGVQAAIWARQFFSASRYVARLVPFLEDVVRLRPALLTGAHFGNSMAHLGLDPNHPVTQRLGTLMAPLFGTP